MKVFSALTVAALATVSQVSAVDTSMPFARLEGAGTFGLTPLSAVDEQLEYGQYSVSFSVPPFDGSSSEAFFQTTHVVQFPRALVGTEFTCTLSCEADTFSGWYDMFMSVETQKFFGDDTFVQGSTCNIAAYLKYVNDLGDDGSGNGEGAFLRAYVGALNGMTGGKITCEATDGSGCLTRIRSAVTRFFSG